MKNSSSLHDSRHYLVLSEELFTFYHYAAIFCFNTRETYAVSTTLLLLCCYNLFFVDEFLLVCQRFSMRLVVLTGSRDVDDVRFQNISYLRSFNSNVAQREFGAAYGILNKMPSVSQQSVMNKTKQKIKIYNKIKIKFNII